MIYAYPCELANDDDGTLVVTFPDVPEAITGGRDRAEAIRLAADALAVALAGYVHDRRDIPEPSPAAEDRELVAVPAVAAAKLALYSAMSEQGIAKSELARRLGSSASAIDQLTDPDRASSIAQVQEALDAVGRSLTIEPYERPPRVPGLWKGKVWIAPDFDDTPQDVIDSFYEGENDDELFGPTASGDGAATDAS